ncbi:hypothetical protein HNR65_002167 [Desulfosalsimonas propionicica]|uniref:Tail tape measure protein n=1 Tax=Desulfosalsimonas propionicica TaxID=332175 RepID=A0A7W0C9V5_9BACT|nr:hypothetical protein [Desulfosalsimonas propionicica]MBA2881836.1 hypothetical protein [Desulfosalsimonas propionicica]
MADHRLQIVLAGKDASQRAFRSVTSRIKGLTKSVFNMRNATVAAAGAAGIGYMIKRNLEAADAIAKTADSVGISTDALQEYRYMAERSGVATATLDKGIGAFTKRLGELKNESGALYSYLKKNNEGLVEQLKATRTTDEALQVFLSSLADVENQSARTAMSAAAFSRTAGIQMTNMVKGGTDGLDQMRDKFEDLGLAIDEKYLRQAEDAVDQITNLETVIKTQFTTAIVQAGPKVAEFTGNMADWIAENDDLITQDIPDTLGKIASGVGKVTRGVAGLADKIGDKYDIVMDFFEGIGDRIPLVDVPQDVWDLAEGKDIHRARVPFDYDKARAGQKDDAARKKTNDLIKKQTQAEKALEQQILKTRKTRGPAGQPDLAVDLSTLEDIDQIYSQTRTPIENLYTDLDRLNELFATGLMDQETYFRGIEMYGEEMAGHFDDMGRSAKDSQSSISEGWDGMMGRMANAFDGWANSYSKTLNDMLWESELTFEGITESFGKMITEMLIQSAMTDAMGALFGTDKQGGTGGGWFSGSGGDGGKAGMVQQGANWAMSALQTYFSMHEGGTVGKDGTPGIAPTGLWNNAPRLHNGLAPDEFPAILQRGERVIPKNQTQGSGGQQQVNLKNINVLDPSIVGDYMATNEGEQLIMNIVQKNRDSI